MTCPTSTTGPFVEDRTLFARDVVRYEGEVVAAVAATTVEIAREAAALIEVDYEPLPVVATSRRRFADGATLVTRAGRATRRPTTSSVKATMPRARRS